ncbi:MAG: hypothetical protein U0401_09365 [Anaerolineae bacterium]
MRRFYIRRKDLSVFPFQFYYDRAGVRQRLGKGHTFTFAISPPKDKFYGLHVHITAEFAQEMEQRWQISSAELILIAAKGLEAWLQGEEIPEDNFNGKDFLRIDRAWYPHGPDGKPKMVSNPYDFEVITAEPWPTDQMWATDPS